MWSKFGSLFKSGSIKNKVVANPQQMIQLAVKEIETAIQKNESSLLKTLENQKEIAGKLEEYKQESKILHMEIAKAIKVHQEEFAQNLNNQKTVNDTQIEQYGLLYKNISQTVYQLRKQIEQLKLQKEEILLKEVILTAKLESATTQKELQNYLSELDSEQQIQLFEEEVTHIELENNLMNDLLSLEDEFDKINQENKLDIARKEVKEMEKGVSAEKAKKIEQIFAQNKIQEQALLKEKQDKIINQKAALLQELMNQSKSVADKEKTLDSFFYQKTESPLEKKISLDEFFEEKGNNQKKIDDFFK